MALLAIAAVAVLLLTAPAKSGRVTVPNLAGETQAAAVSSLRHEGLVPVVLLAANARVPTGQVVGSTPPGGTIVAKGSRVSVVVSSGPGVIGLPDVNGKSSSDAVKILRDAGFQPTTQSQASESVEKGRVISTDPAAGIEVQVGSPVTVLVSSGPKEVSVPEVTGETQADATATLAAAGLKVSVSKREVAEPASGTVISQTPGGGTQLKVGGQVTIVVAEALKKVAAPSLVGQSEAQAIATLTSAGFSSNTVSRTVTDPTKVGIVVQQSPEAGHKLAAGATVTIAVGVLAQQTTSTSTTTTTPPTPPPSAPATGAPSASG